MTTENSKQVVVLGAARETWRNIVTLLESRGFKVDVKNPLNKGVYRDIREALSADEISSNKLHEAIGFHVNSIKYLRKMREGAKRYNIRGEVAGIVSKEEQEYALSQLKKIHPTFRMRKKKVSNKAKPRGRTSNIRHKKSRKIQHQAA